MCGNVSHERQCKTKIPRRGEQAAAAAVRLPFFLRSIGGKGSAVSTPLCEKEKKKQKKKSSRLPLFCAAMYRTKGSAIFVTHNINSPEGGTGGCCRRKTALFSPLYRGERLSGEHAARLPLFCAAMYCTKGSAIFVKQNKNPPEGGTGGCCRRKTALFSPLYRGERLSGEHTARLPLFCAAVYHTKGSVLLLIKLYLSFSLYNRYWKPMLLKG